MEEMTKTTETGSKGIVRDENGRLLPGYSSLNPGGKPKGVKENAVKIKQTIFKVFLEIFGDPEKPESMEKLREFARRKPYDFLNLVVRALPREMDISNDNEGAKLILIRSGDKLENRVEVAVIDGLKSTLPNAETATVVEAKNPPPEI
jgi:hypothetical protein